jgi:NAD(P)-dependent dehydrogenase (short-subunit alcohol dehydrogenase family)
MRKRCAVRRKRNSREFNNINNRRIEMVLKNKNAVIYGAGGAIGSAIARRFAQEGARVFLTGRTLPIIEAIAKDIAFAGGFAEVAQVDALDENSIENHINNSVEKAGGIDISFNAISIPQQGIQGISLAELPVDSFVLPISTYTRSHFLTARAAVRRMLKKRSGVILVHTPEPARLAAPLVGGMAPAWAAMEALSRDLSAEFGAQGIRAICLRSTRIPETGTIDVVFGLHAKAMGISREQFQSFMESMGHTRRSTTLAELANAAVFAVSDQASGMTGAVVNLTGGKIAD